MTVRGKNTSSFKIKKGITKHVSLLIINIHNSKHSELIISNIAVFELFSCTTYESDKLPNYQNRGSCRRAARGEVTTNAEIGERTAVGTTTGAEPDGPPLPNDYILDYIPDYNQHTIRPRPEKRCNELIKKCNVINKLIILTHGAIYKNNLTNNNKKPNGSQSFKHQGKITQFATIILFISDRWEAYSPHRAPHIGKILRSCHTLLS